MMLGGVELMHDGSDLTSESAREELWAAFDGMKEEVAFMDHDRQPEGHASLNDIYNPYNLLYFTRGVNPLVNNPKAK